MSCFSVFVDQRNLKIIWKFSLSQYRCHKTLIDVENCVKNALNSNHIKQNFAVITIWGGGDHQLRSALAAKQIWVAVITIWGTLDSLPRKTRKFQYTNRAENLEWWISGLMLNPLFLLISRLNIACSPLIFNHRLIIRSGLRISHSKVSKFVRLHCSFYGDIIDASLQSFTLFIK